MAIERTEGPVWNQIKMEIKLGFQKARRALLYGDRQAVRLRKQSIENSAGDIYIGEDKTALPWRRKPSSESYTFKYLYKKS